MPADRCIIEQLEVTKVLRAEQLDTLSTAMSEQQHLHSRERVQGWDLFQSAFFRGSVIQPF